jgi:hypothetical protein
MQLILAHASTPSTAASLPAIRSDPGPPIRAEAPGGVPLNHAPVQVPGATSTACPACRLVPPSAARAPAASIPSSCAAAIRYLKFIASFLTPTAEAPVSEATAGMHRAAAADVAGLNDRGLLLTDFAGALRCTELAAIRVEYLEPCERGLRLTLPHSNGGRTGSGVTVAPPYGTIPLSLIRALRSWQAAAGINAGALFRRIWAPPRGREGRNTPLPRLGSAAIDAGTVAWIIQARGRASTLRSWAVTASSAASIRPASNGWATTRSTLCSKTTSNSATRSRVIRPMACCDRPRPPPARRSANLCAMVRERRDHSQLHAATESQDPGTKPASSVTNVCWLVRMRGSDTPALLSPRQLAAFSPIPFPKPHAFHHKTD